MKCFSQDKLDHLVRRDSKGSVDPQVYLAVRVALDPQDLEAPLGRQDHPGREDPRVRPEALDNPETEAHRYVLNAFSQIAPACI